MLALAAQGYDDLQFEAIFLDAEIPDRPMSSINRTRRNPSLRRSRKRAFRPGQRREPMSSTQSTRCNRPAGLPLTSFPKFQTGSERFIAIGAGFGGGTALITVTSRTRLLRP